MKLSNRSILSASSSTLPSIKPRLTERALYRRTRLSLTGKEQDSETGLYYYGARYLDSKTGRWLSGDPAVSEYIPSAPINDEARKQNQNLPGMGGVFNYINLHAYHYAGNNPVKYTDPDGNEVVKSWYGGMSQLNLNPRRTQNASMPSNASQSNGTVSGRAVNDTPTLEDVIAIHGGTVSRSGWQNPNDHNAGLGWRISIDRSDGYVDYYGHLDETYTLPEGTQVAAGDVIGRMANPTNGYSTGPHVHFETRDSNTGNSVDPGDTSPFRGRSRIASPYQAEEPNLRTTPHQGVDHVPIR